MPSFRVPIFSGDNGVRIPMTLGFWRRASSPPEAAATNASTRCVKGRSRMVMTEGLVVLR